MYTHNECIPMINHHEGSLSHLLLKYSRLLENIRIIRSLQTFPKMLFSRRMLNVFVPNPLAFPILGFPGGSDSKGKHLPAMWEAWFDSWVRTIPWRRKWWPTPVLLLGKFHGWRSLVGYSSWDCRIRYDWATSLIHWFPILANATLSIQSLDTETFESFYYFFSLNPHTQSINYITKTADASSLTSLE